MIAILEINNGQEKNDPLAISDTDNGDFDNLSMLDFSACFNNKQNLFFLFLRVGWGRGDLFLACVKCSFLVSN